MARIHVKLDNASDEFKRGFMAATEFWEGVGTFLVERKGCGVTCEVHDRSLDDNIYALDHTGRVVFDSTGVER